MSVTSHFVTPHDRNYHTGFVRGLIFVLLLVFSLLKSIPYLSSKNELSRKEEKMIFCMDYAGIGETEQKYRLIENTTLEPYFIDNRLTGEQLTYFFKQSSILTNHLPSGAAAILTDGVSALVQHFKADSLRKELIRCHLDAY